MSDNLNTQIDAWSLKVTALMLENISALGLVSSGKLVTSLKYKMRVGKDGDVERISWRANKYGFVLAQSGRNYTFKELYKKKVGKEIKSITAYTKKTSRKDTLGRYILNYIDRDIAENGQRDWAFNTIKKEAPVLGNVIAQIYKDRCVKASSILTIAGKLSAK